MAAAPHERQRDADRTKAEILAAATQEFAEHGYSGARVDVIATKTRTTKRMLYYYFESKAGLYTAVLEQSYAGIRESEQELDVEELDPVAAIRRLAELTFDHHESHPDFVRLVMIENIHRAEHLEGSDSIANLNMPAIAIIGRILERGRAEGVFRRDADAIDVHMMISSFCIFRVANRHTFTALFGRDLMAGDRRDHYRAMLGDMVVDYLRASEG
jgi:AcrR family transcriptional regulator